MSDQKNSQDSEAKQNQQGVANPLQKGRFCTVGQSDSVETLGSSQTSEPQLTSNSDVSLTRDSSSRTNLDLTLQNGPNLPINQNTSNNSTGQYASKSVLQSTNPNTVDLARIIEQNSTNSLGFQSVHSTDAFSQIAIAEKLSQIPKNSVLTQPISPGIELSLGSLNTDGIGNYPSSFATVPSPGFATLQVTLQPTSLSQTLNKRISELERELKVAQKENGNMLEIQGKLKRTQELQYLSERICHSAQNAMAVSKELQSAFESRTCKAFVMSVDIRSSTTLMLKARTAKDFADFVNRLVKDFKEAITSNHGVYDKFTGDGVLAFFPEFYTGQYAGFYAVKAAISCHQAFQRVYESSRKYFKSIPTDAGLGIGVDFGEVHLLRMAEGLTVVGEPVVYACRLSGAPSGKTLVNQPAYEEIVGTTGPAFHFHETEHEFKHEGPQLAYSVVSSSVEFPPPPVAWKQIAESTSNEALLKAGSQESSSHAAGN